MEARTRAELEAAARALLQYASTNTCWGTPMPDLTRATCEGDKRMTKHQDGQRLAYETVFDWATRNRGKVVGVTGVSYPQLRSFLTAHIDSLPYPVRETADMAQAAYEDESVAAKADAVQFEAHKLLDRVSLSSMKRGECDISLDDVEALRTAIRTLVRLGGFER